MPGVVLVHGSQHGSWCWRYVVEGLEQQGVRTVAVDLPGRGASADRPIGYAEGLAVVEEAIQSLGGPVVLCGHSAAGMPISLAAVHQRKAVGRLVYLSAVLPAGDETMSGVVEELMSRAQRHLRFENDKVAVPPLEDAVELMYHDCAPDVARWAHAQLVAEAIPDPATAPPGAAQAAPWESVPVTYVICTEDRSNPLHIQRRLATRAHEVVELPTSHSPFLSRPDLVVDLLARHAREAAAARA